MAARRRPRPASMPWEIRGRNLFGLLLLYAQDDDFGTRLVDFYQEVCVDEEAFLAPLQDTWQVNEVRWRGLDGHEWADVYLVGLADLAADFGLDRIGRPEGRGDDGKYWPSEGEGLLHSWCFLRAAESLRGGRNVGVDEFPNTAEESGMVGNISAELRRQDKGEETDVPEVDDDGPPIVRVEITGNWDPGQELKRSAQKRLMDEAGRQIDADLERIAEAAETVGFRFDAPRHLRRDLVWLFLKLGKGLNFRVIVELWGRDDEVNGVAKQFGVPDQDLHSLLGYENDRVMVGKAVARMADSSGVSRRGW